MSSYRIHPQDDPSNSLHASTAPGAGGLDESSFLPEMRDRQARGKDPYVPDMSNQLMESYSYSGKRYVYALIGMLALTVLLRLMR